MRYLKSISLIALLLTTFLSASAQAGLNVAPFFSESYSKNPKVTLLSLSGLGTQAHGAMKYKSISVSDDPLLTEKIESAVVKDGSRAKHKEVKYKDGSIYFGFYLIGGSGKNRKYLLYLNRNPKGIDKITLIYIEGDLSKEDVKQMIKVE